MKSSTTLRWVDTNTMADSLGMSVVTLMRYRKLDDERQFLIEGTHFRRSSPAPRSPWVWDAEKTQKAFAIATRRAR